MRRMLSVVLSVALLAMTAIGCSSTPKKPKITNFESSSQTGPYLRLFQNEMAQRGIQIMYPMELRVYVSKNTVPA